MFTDVPVSGVSTLVEHRIASGSLPLPLNSRGRRSDHTSQEIASLWRDVEWVGTLRSARTQLK
jgi:hypothetical protein